MRSKLMKLLLLVFFSSVSLLCQTKWWNNQWNFRSSIPQDIKPVMGNIYAAKVDFTSLINSVLQGEAKKFDMSSIRVIGVKKDGSFSEVRFNFVPHPNFDAEKDVRGTLVWEKGENIEKYYVYYDVLSGIGKPVSQNKSDIDINLLKEGSFDTGTGKFSVSGGNFDDTTGYVKKGCVKIRFNKETSQGYVMSNKVQAEPDTVYDLIFFAKGEAEQSNNFAIYGYVNYYDENDKYLDRTGAKLETRARFDWTPYLMTVRTPANAKKIAVHIGTYQDTGYIWLDDIRITPQVTYMIDNIEKQSGDVKKISGIKISFDFVEIKYPDFYKPEAKPEPEEQKLGFYVWESRPEIIIYPYTKAPDVRKKEVNAWGALGETITRNFCIRPITDIESIHIEVEENELKNFVLLREMKYLPRIHLAKTYHIVPGYLDKLSNKLQKGITTQYYLTISIPENARPGIYSGNIKISGVKSTNEKFSFSMPLTLRVLPFKLLRPENVYWGFFYGNYDWATAYGSPSDKKVFYPEQEPLMFKHMVQHNANMVGISGALPTYEIIDGKYVFDFTKTIPMWQSSIKNSLDNAVKAGIKCVFLEVINQIYHNSTYFKDTPIMSEEWKRSAINLQKELHNYIKKNYPKIRVYYQTIDEPANSKKLTDDCIELCKLVKSEINDILLFGTLHTSTLPLIGPLVDACMIFAGEVNENTIKLTREIKKELWSDNGGSFGRDYSIDRFYTGFYLWKTKGQGIGQWAYMWPKGPDAYDDFTSKRGYAGDFYALPSPEGPKDTPGIEGFRDGIYDYMYLYTLETSIEKIKKSGNKEKIKQAEKAMEEIQNEIIDKIPLAYKYDFVKAENFQPDTMDAWKWKIAQKIMFLENL